MTAIKVDIESIIKARFEKKEGWEPNTISINGKITSKINVIAAVVGKEDSVFILDDSSATIVMKDVSGMAKGIMLNDVVLVIGPINEIANERFIMAEIVRKIDPAWAQYRRKELSTIVHEKTPSAKPVHVEIESDNVVMRIYNLIKELDLGDGADYDEVLVKSKYNNAASVIDSLIEDGEVFQPKPSRLKIL